MHVVKNIEPVLPFVYVCFGWDWNYWTIKFSKWKVYIISNSSSFIFQTITDAFFKNKQLLFHISQKTCHQLTHKTKELMFFVDKAHHTWADFLSRECRFFIADKKLASVGWIPTSYDKIESCRGKIKVPMKWKMMLLQWIDLAKWGIAVKIFFQNLLWFSKY